MKKGLTVWPAYILLAVLGYEVALNAATAVLPAASVRGQDGLAVSPEIAFNWLQLIAGGGMWLLLLWAVRLSVKSLGKTAAGQRLPWNVPHTLAALTLLLFSAPAWWLWFWTAAQWLQGRQPADFGNWHYVLAALCQPFVLFLPLAWWRGQRRLRRKSPPVLTPPSA